MKKGCGYCHDSGLLILRLLLVAVFVFHAVVKITSGDAMVGFVGGAPALVGLSFLSATTWFYIAVAGEFFFALTTLLGFWTRFGVVVLWIIMFFAMTAKQRGFPAIEMDLIIVGLGLVLFVAGPGRFSLGKHAGCDTNDHPHSA